MKGLAWRLFMDWGSLFIQDPAEKGFYRKVDLIFTGHHYRLSLDRFDVRGPHSKWTI